MATNGSSRSSIRDSGMHSAISSDSGVGSKT